MSGNAFYQGVNYRATIVFAAIVIDPVLASILPSTVAPVFNVMDCMARTVPLNTVVVPKVAELPTCQKILEAKAPPLKITLRPDVVVRVVAIWMIKIAAELPFASNVRSPDEMASDEVDLYNPGVSVSPPILPDKVTISLDVRPERSL